MEGRKSSESVPVAVVTGANCGLGFETALGLADRGAHVVIACRSEDKGRAAIETLRSKTERGSFELGLLDLGDLSSIRAFAEGLAHDRIDVLVNNAGIMATPHWTTKDGFEAQLGVNHLGHFALTGLLLDRLRASPGARVVTVSSLAANSGRIDFEDLHSEQNYRPMVAYKQSKLANLLFVVELARRLEAAGSGIQSVACHPGFASTSLGEELTERSRIEGWILRMAAALFARSPAAGAQPAIFAATSDDLSSPGYYGPGGRTGLWGAPCQIELAGSALDPDVGRRLWSVSETLTGVRYNLA